MVRNLRSFVDGLLIQLVVRVSEWKLPNLKLRAEE
jgi:hypothetical protein